MARLPGVGWALKVYYELTGWRPPVVRDVLRLAKLDDDVTGLTPDVPGVVQASLAAHRRSGIAVRIDLATGDVRNVTVAATFPTPLAGREQVAARASRWLEQVEGTPVPHDRAVAQLLPRFAWAPPVQRLHSLFTRTRTRNRSGDAVKVYLRPGCGR